MSLPSRRARRYSSVALATILAVGFSPRTARAQRAQVSDSSAGRFVLHGPAEERARLSQLTDSAPTGGWLLRSPSSSSAPSHGWSVLPAYLAIGHQSGRPLPGNDGPLWPGLSLSARLVIGARADLGRFHAIVAPELLYSQNRAYALADSTWPRDPARSPFAAPWYAGPHSADLPLRFGDRPLRRGDVGQSSLFADVGPVQVGGATENEWWGPGMENAILLSDAAAGFPHLFARTRAPIATSVGAFEARWLVGGLRESPYLDANGANDLRSISVLGLTWQPIWEPGLTVGAGRAVYAPTRNWGSALGDFWQVFADVGQPNSRPAADSTITPGRDQLFSLFARWVFPADGFEAYLEWARSELPKSFRDWLLEPNHSQGYTLGAQWVSPRRFAGGRPRISTEFTYLEQSPTFRNRPEGWFYTSRAVIQGYTQRGEPLGASIGPGGSSQYLEVGWVGSSWLAGAMLRRVRWNDDALAARPAGPSYDWNWCRHDVSMLPGARAAFRMPLGSVGVDYEGGRRMNPFFRAPAGSCLGSSPYDVSTHALRLTWQTRLP